MTVLLADHFGEHTLPILIIAGSAVVIALALLVRWWRGRRGRRPAAGRGRRRASAGDLRTWQEGDGRVLDRWMAGVEKELDALRGAAFPDTVEPAADPAELDGAVASCPDGGLRADIETLRTAANAMLTAARADGPSSPEAVAAEQRYEAAKAAAGARLAGAPQ